MRLRYDIPLPIRGNIIDPYQKTLQQYLRLNCTAVEARAFLSLRHGHSRS